MERFRNDVGERLLLKGILVGAEPKDVQGVPTSCTIELLNQDLTATIVLWGKKCAEVQEMLGHPILLEVKVRLWRDSVQLTWNEPFLLEGLDESVDVYIPISKDYYGDLYKLDFFLEMLDSERPCTQITRKMFQLCREKFIDVPAGKKVHHNYKGGLLEHTVEVASLAHAIIETDRTLGLGYLDETLTMCGALLHDIGKVREYAFENFNPVLTLEGKTNSHLFLGASMVYHVAADLKYATTEPDVLKLVNIIQSHHGTKEFGNLMDPMTLEAEVVHHCDSISSRGQVLQRIKDVTTGGNRLAEGFVGGKRVTILV